MDIKIKYQCMMVRKDITYKPLASFFLSGGRGRRTHPKNLDMLNKNIKKKIRKVTSQILKIMKKIIRGMGGGGG